MKKWLYLTLICFFQNAYAITPLPLFEHEAAPVDFEIFLVSSEMQIGKIKPILQNAPAGAYLTVGAERSFRAASMMPNISYLIQLDIDKSIVRYNLINKELLKTTSRLNYRHLRWEASFLEWKAYMAQAHQRGHLVKLSSDDYEWWQTHVRDLNEMQYALPEQLNRYENAPPCPLGEDEYERNIDLASVLDFKSGNYLFDDKCYQALHKLAIEDRILTTQINLLNPEQITKLLNYISEYKLKIGVLDLDNLYHQDYLGSKNYTRLIKTLAPFTLPDSILLVMSNYKDYACAQFQFYMGFRMSRINAWPGKLDMQSFIDKLPPPTHDLIDGKLFEKDDKLPN